MALSLSTTTRPILYPPSISNTTSSAAATSPSINSLSLRSSNSCRRLRHSAPILHSSSSNLGRARRSVRRSISVDDSYPFDASGEVSPPNASTAYVKPPVNLKALFKAYREAVLIGDVEAVAQIESMIYVLEKERDKLDQKVLTLSAEISSGKEKFIRLQADFDNFRKRSEKERLTIRSDAQGEVIESLLPMVDNFERAKQQLKPETEMEKKIDVSYQGIYKQFVEIMRSLRVSVVATVGKPFDPKLHEAIAREESQDYKEGIITQEFRRGFLLGDRLLRPAMVKVSSGPGRKKTAEPSDTPTAVAGADE
ncbi:unnamed protein product [Rhodiola kirilowii]